MIDPQELQQAPYEKPVVDSYTEQELEASVEAVGGSVGGGV